VRLLTRAEPAERLRAAGVVVEIDRLLASPRRHAWTAAAGLAAFVILASVGIGAVRPGAARSIRDVTLSSTMILPDMVVPTGGVPATLSADGLRIAAVTDGPGLRLRALDDADGGDTVPLDFRPDRLAFSPAGDRLAAADEGGHLLILDVPTGGATLRHRFDRGVGWLGWAGWNREALLVQSGGEVHSFCKTRKAASDASIPDWWLEFLRGDVQRLATLPGTEGIISTGGDGRITMWSAGRFTDDTALPLGDPVWISRRDLFGWKGRGSCYVVTGRQILEFAPYHGIRAAEIVAPAESIAWIGESRYAFVTDAASGPPRLLLGDLARPGWSRACELGSETPLQLHVLYDQRVAVATREGTIRIYQPRF